MIYMTKNINYDKMLKGLVFGLVVLSSFFIYFYKLDYESFFTDEIIFVKSGLEAIYRNEYSLILEVPLVGKYLAGLSALFDERNIYIMRIPYALLGIFTAFIIFKILQKEYGFYWGVSGFLLFILSPILYYSTRMVMLEAPMHLFWILFSYYFLEFAKTAKWKTSILSGIFLGLALGTKFTSIVLFPISGISILILLFTKYKLNKVAFLKKAFVIYLVSGVAFIFTYIDLIIHQSFTRMYDVLRSVKDRYISKETGGKIHVVDGQAFNTSPWWYYFHYVQKMYTYLQTLLYGLAPIVLFLARNVFTFYWFAFLITTFTFQQILIVKSMRYFSSVELPLIFLSIILLRYFYEKLQNKKLAILIIFLLFLSIVSGRLFYISKLAHTRYQALQKFLIEKTNNFANGDRTYIFGSIRSSRWYFASESKQKTRSGAFDGFTPEDMVVSRKDFGVIGKEFHSFKYLVVDTDEILKGQGIKLTEFIRSNIQNLDLVRFPGLDVYIRKNP